LVFSRRRFPQGKRRFVFWFIHHFRGRQLRHGKKQQTAEHLNLRTAVIHVRPSDALNHENAILVAEVAEEAEGRGEKRNEFSFCILTFIPILCFSQLPQLPQRLISVGIFRGE
jgi:hypothetical protein